MKNILVTGCCGFIGRSFIQRFHNKYNIIGVDILVSKQDCFCKKEYTFDICDMAAMQRIFEEQHIDAVVHTAAEKSLIKCEAEQERAFKVNYVATVQLMRLAEQYHSKLIFLSSDQVFDGRNSMYTEDAMINAINYYGKLKIMAEHQLLQHKNTAICRTALVFGDIPPEQLPYFYKIRNMNILPVQGFIVQHTRYCLENRRELILPDDEYVSPTHVCLLADQIDRVIEYDVVGVLHCCGKGRISRYEMGMHIASHYGAENNKDCILPFGQNNPLRPKDVSLDCTISEKKLHMRFLSFTEMLEKYTQES